ncbi:BMP family ABC transporter substrate-binding protein [Prevotella sp.]|uniref:BMP family ABC transporter substrate-binding protein n=1 Tax=Prevotella sp. TaxID=59823 RepID=UPI0026490EBB|nr:BMP family ABC transporter substrate-binding protein [Prevotella sp.]MDN5553046.1 BMP family ABC transporter substrate-binding protein [Prevotella sp.]
MSRFSGLLLIALLFLLYGCNSEYTYEQVDNPKQLVRIVFSPGALGDFSYSDDILRGILLEQKESGFRLYCQTPSDMNKTETLIRQWQMEDGDSTCFYTILAGSQFEKVAKYTRPDRMRSNYLMFETKDTSLNVSTFRYCGYGTSFLAGIAAYAMTKSDSTAYLGGCKDESFIEDCYQGFRDGYIYAGGHGVAETYISDSSDGFSMPSRAYEMADSLFEKYPFIYAMAGGSNNGVYLYLHEHPGKQVYTNGVDIDQSPFCDRIIGCMIKHIGSRVGNYIHSWIKGNVVPKHIEYGLSSGSIGFVIAEPYKAKLETIVKSATGTAIRKEKEYENTSF